MNFKQVTENWKCVGAIVATAVFLCGTAITADNRYAKQVDMKQMQLAQNYNNFQMRLDSLRAACEKSPCSAETIRTMQWLEKQIKLIEKAMEASN